MKNKGRLVLLLVIFLSVISTSCDKFSGDTDFIAGVWRCREESGDNGFRQYSVTIYRAGSGFDSTHFVINNFHNLGYEVETYVQLINSEIIINSMDGFIASGKGIVSKDFKSIEWEYSISNDYVKAYYFRK